MATFHKPKVFRSLVGCCICRTKSSSSRFTDSSKYEDQFQSCFKLEEERVGEICNACVLLVKRWKKLPKNNKRNWAHVVDARSGPGGKSFVKQKKKEDNIEEFDKIRKKYYEKKISRSDDDVTVNSAESPMLYEEAKPDAGGFTASAARLQENQLSDFFDSSYWKKERICCGFIFRGLLGEMMVDSRLIQKCPLHDPDRSDEPDLPSQTVQTFIESELRKLAQKKGEETVAVKEVERSESDEGFCDKSSTVTGPSSPDSLGFNICLEDE